MGVLCVGWWPSGHHLFFVSCFLVMARTKKTIKHSHWALRLGFELTRNHESSFLVKFHSPSFRQKNPLHPVLPLLLWALSKDTNLNTNTHKPMATASEVLNKILTCKGQHVTIRFKTNPAPASPKKLNAGIVLEKETKGAFKAGINYANIKEVREAIEAGERGPVQAPKGRKWKQFPHILESEKTGEELVRLYPASGDNQHPSVVYRVNGNEVTKEDFVSYLPESKRQSEAKICFDLKVANILDMEEA